MIGEKELTFDTSVITKEMILPKKKDEKVWQCPAKAIATS